MQNKKHHLYDVALLSLVKTPQNKTKSTICCDDTLLSLVKTPHEKKQKAPSVKMMLTAENGT